MINSISEIANLWQKILNRIEEKLNEKQVFDTFFENSYINEIQGNTFVVVVNSAFAATMMESKYKDIINAAIEEVTQTRFETVFVQQEALNSNKNIVAEQQKKVEYFKDARINSECTFDSFVMGGFNREAGQAALMVAANPGKMFNPLFIYSNSGLGKTHLMHAIGNYITKVTKPGAKVLYITSEEFVEAYTKFARGDKEAESLKDYVTSFDVFLMDDIQFLANKVKSQEMFFYIFEKLVNNGKQIVITCDKQPSELEGIEERLVTRFSKGLLVNIKKPDAETCAEILKRKIVNAGIKLENVDPSVITFYAEKFSSDIRTLEGAFTRLIFFVVKLKQANLITMDLAIEAVQNMVGTEKLENQLSGTRIINVVADYYNLAPTQLTGKIRTEDIATPRHIAMYLIRYNTELSLKQIGKLFGGRDHTTIMSGVEKVENALKTNLAIKQAVSELEKKLKIK